MSIVIGQGWTIGPGWNVQGGPPGGTYILTISGFNITTLSGNKLITA
jgi:hypothetical protein